jgi:hypothetical protein
MNQTNTFLRINSESSAIENNYDREKNKRHFENKFNKTITHQVSCYTTLPHEEKMNKTDRIKFQNSMNRILDAEMISFKLLNTGYLIRSNRSDRRKLHTIDHFS